MTILHRLSTSGAVTALVIGIAVGAPSTASAQSQADFEQMKSAMQRLEARVAALEGENKQAKQEAAAARAEARVLRQKMGAAAPSPAAGAANVAALRPGIYAMATKAPALPPAPLPGWSGMYWGAGFGLGWMRGDVTEASFGTSSGFAVGLGPFGGGTTTSNSALDGRNAGAIANLYLGYNFVATPTIVLGGQVEGDVSNIRVNLAGSGSTVSRTATGAIDGTETFTTTNALDNRWMVSVLGRGGVLVDPADFVYLLGGYTYGRFEAFGLGFGLNGGTIGAGWERQVAPGWTLRGEYRYTKFADKDVNQNSVTTTNSPGPGAFTETATSATTDHVSADMHSVWIGVAHYFGQ